MCGIAGYTSFNNLPDSPQNTLESMVKVLTPRGPDAEGYFIDPSIALGHRRLSIIDIKGGAQPFSGGGGRYHLVYNGEVYNYIELRQMLTQQGIQFKTKSDTEVLLQLFIHERIKGIERVNGMFSFAVWDKDDKTLFLVRDRIGIKPLYYTVQNHELIFASELKSLLKYPKVDRTLNLLSVQKYLTFGYVPAPHTIYEGIYKLEPGYYLKFNQGGLQKKCYWDIPLEDNPISARNVDQCSEEMLELLKDAVKKRLRSDVPIGVFLSGGLDSSTLAALASKAMGGGLHTFSMGFEDESYDESPYALQVSKLYQTTHHHEVLTTDSALQLLPEVMSRMDEPFADASILPTYLLSKFTAQHVKVVLGGDGGDELFAGYPSFQAHKLMESLSILPLSWRDSINRVARKLPVSHRYASVEFLVQQFMKGTGISPEIRFFMWMGYFSHEQKKQLLTESVKNALLRENPYEDILNYVKQSGLVSDFERILYLCMKMYLQDDILVKVDRASMSHSLEVRVPFLDHHLVEYVSGIQSAYKLKGFTTKYLLKEATKKLLPKTIRYRRKAGFMMPVAKWLKEDLKKHVEEVFFDPSVKEDGLFDTQYLQRLFEDHIHERRDNRKQIWNLYSFLIWKKNFEQN